MTGWTLSVRAGATALLHGGVKGDAGPVDAGDRGDEQAVSAAAALTVTIAAARRAPDLRTVSG
jgi:hypothetical protein